MLKNPVLFKKTLVIGIIVLFLGLGAQPAFAVEQSEEELINDSPKDFLFQTVIDIVNNPEIQNLLGQYDNDLFKVEIDRSIIRKLMFKNPLLFLNFLFTKPTNTHEYLDNCYKIGHEIFNIIGEDKALGVIESVDISDNIFFNEIDTIVKKDEALSNKLSTIKETKLSFSNSILDNILLQILLRLIAFTFIAVLAIVIIINLVTNGNIQLFYWLEVALWFIYWEFIHDLLP